jgi:predicted metal-dependent hydrolase
LIFDEENNNIYFDGLNFYLHKKHKNIVKEKLIIFYKLEAKKHIEKRAIEIAQINNLKFNTLKITSAKTRWGSCTSKQNVNFSYRLILAPMKTIDYVIIHELAHLKEMNHSKKFWLLVDNMSKSLYP